MSLFNFINAILILLCYYILKLYYNHKLRILLRVVNGTLVFAIILILIFSLGSQNLFDSIFALEAVILVITGYNFFDKYNYSLYNIIAKMNVLPIIFGWEWFNNKKKDRENILNFIEGNPLFLRSNRDKKIMVITKEETYISLILIFLKKRELEEYLKGVIMNRDDYIKSTSRIVSIHLKRGEV